MNQPFQVMRYGVLVWENEAMDALRRKECLCLHCGSMKTCRTAGIGLGFCREFNIAFAMTRCPNWTPSAEYPV